eukprot:16505-Heterococcus_DN1.PRE.5
MQYTADNTDLMKDTLTVSRQPKPLCAATSCASGLHLVSQLYPSVRFTPGQQAVPFSKVITATAASALGGVRAVQEAIVIPAAHEQPSSLYCHSTGHTTELNFAAAALQVSHSCAVAVAATAASTTATATATAAALAVQLVHSEPSGAAANAYAHILL